MSDEQLAQAKTKILHIPTVLGAVVPAYNVPGISGEVKFTPEALAGIFLGKITNWNDPAITKSNPGVNFPNQPIIVIYRPDGSGTTFIFTDYLSKISKDWANTVGKGTSVNWPVGLGGQGNPGVASTVKQTPGAIGYIEWSFSSGLGVAKVDTSSTYTCDPPVDAITATQQAGDQWTQDAEAGPHSPHQVVVGLRRTGVLLDP